MRRVLLRLLGVAVFTWLEFVVFPGHTYLQADTQLSVPMLERLVNPGFLSRDLVAVHPNLQYTVYDEATLFLHQAGVSIENALLAQQIACRAACMLGILLLSLSAGMTEVFALLIAACVNLGANLTGPAVMLVEMESIPRALAWGLIVLAIGLLAREKPLLTGLAAGFALIYSPTIAGPFWLLLIVVLIVDRRLRRLLRPTMTALGIFVLLLANLAQLQPGVADNQAFFSKISASYAALQQFRTPYQWVSLWTAGQLWSYLAIWVCGMWAISRIWPALNRQARWFFIALPACGVLSIPVSYLLLDRLHWSFIPQIEPTRWLLFAVCLSSVACLIAGIRAATARKSWEGALWFLVALALPFRTEVLELLRLTRLDALERLAAAVLLACTLALLLRADRKLMPVSLLTPLLAIALLQLPRFEKADEHQQQTVLDLAEWAKANTWGSSMFLFPDLGRSRAPGLFRARSERALWVDWNSGALVPYFQSFAAMWWDRWQQTMQDGYSVQRLGAALSQPIDYYVLTRANRIEAIKPVFANEEFEVYDANDLRNAPSPLRSVRRD
ncbi:MAG TPA: hypothetical protein VFA65_13940 [Bryobacteraceae bacterium]|nr:hypothetical protein [Bryobacteraceae bacterium]